MKKNNIKIFKGGAQGKEKYDDNKIHNWLIYNFMKSVVELVNMTGKKDIFEIGCGEGQIIGVLHDNGYEVSGIDLSEEAVEIALNNFKIANIEADIKQGNIYEKNTLKEGKMIVCCEVLEHLEDPEKALKIIYDLADEYFLVSVPREPLWCFLNFLRGKYWKTWGNTPGHINHWSKGCFLQFLKKQGGTIVAVKTPCPWTMVLVKK